MYAKLGKKYADKDMCKYLIKYGKTKKIALMYAKLGKKYAGIPKGGHK